MVKGLFSLSRHTSIELQSDSTLCEILFYLRSFLINMVTPLFLLIMPSEFID